MIDFGNILENRGSSNLTKDRACWLSADIWRPCPLCGSDRYLPLSRRMQHTLDLQTVICAECSFVFTNPMPSLETYERFYAEAYSKYYSHTAPAVIGAVQVEEPRFIRAKLDSIENILKLEGKRLLEIGSGQGLFLWWAQKRGCEVLGVEPTREFCPALAKAKLPYRHSLFAQVNAAEIGDFDVLVMSHVLEHFYDPDEALSHCRRLLASGGLLVVEVPNILKPFRSLDDYFLRYVHPSCFSPATLRAFLERHAFRIQYMDEGRNDWRTPQNIFAIASKEKQIPGQCNMPTQKAQEVLQILRRYRHTWKCKLALMGMIRDAWLQTRRIAIKHLRPVKRKLSSFRQPLSRPGANS